LPSSLAAAAFLGKDRACLGAIRRHDLAAEEKTGTEQRRKCCSCHRSRLRRLPEGKSANYRSRIEDLKQPAIFAQQFESVRFLTQMALPRMSKRRMTAADRDEERMRLSTIHQAKGLECDVVFIIMSRRTVSPPAPSRTRRTEAEEEERRFTWPSPARNELLERSADSCRYGNGGVTMQQPSRFLEEIPDELVEEWNLRTFS
jgi:DNA helicase-2/ATP-dependent DNA helicase PcrA